MRLPRYGDGIGILTAYLQVDGLKPVPMWTMIGEQDDDWLQGRVGFAVDASLSILIEARITATEDGDMGLDDIQIINGYCPTFPAFAVPSSGLTTPVAPITTPTSV